MILSAKNTRHWHHGHSRPLRRFWSQTSQVVVHIAVVAHALQVVFLVRFGALLELPRGTSTFLNWSRCWIFRI